MECICEPGKTSDDNCGHCHPPATVIYFARHQQRRRGHPRRRPQPVTRLRVAPSEPA